MKRTYRTQELLDLIQEESGEVVQAISKLRRFGELFRGRGGADQTAHENFQQEVWDLQILLNILASDGYIKLEVSPEYLKKKIAKLKTWTSIYDYTH